MKPSTAYIASTGKELLAVKAPKKVLDIMDKSTDGNLGCNLEVGSTPQGSMAELVDAADLKSVGRKRLWGFKSPCSHL